MTKILLKDIPGLMPEKNDIFYSSGYNRAIDQIGEKAITINREKLAKLKIKCPDCESGVQSNPEWRRFHKRFPEGGTINDCLEYFKVLDSKSLPWEERDCKLCHGTGFKVSVDYELADAIISNLDKIIEVDKDNK